MTNLQTGTPSSSSHTHHTEEEAREVSQAYIRGGRDQGALEQLCVEMDPVQGRLRPQGGGDQQAAGGMLLRGPVPQPQQGGKQFKTE